MAWTTPATFTTGEVVTAAKLNAQVRDNLDFLHTARIVSVGTLSTAAITTSTWTLINFTFEVVDTMSGWSAGAPSRITPTIAGYYQIRGCVNWASDATKTGSRAARLWVNGATLYDQDTRAGLDNTHANQVSRVIYFNGSTDFVELQCWHSKGSDHNLSSAGQATWLEAIWIGA